MNTQRVVKQVFMDRMSRNEAVAKRRLRGAGVLIAEDEQSGQNDLELRIR